MYFDLPVSALNLLVPLYNSPQRYYHNLNHIHYCLSKIDEYASFFSLSDNDLGAIVFAIWFHDAVYSPFKWSTSSNEKESALLFENWWQETYDNNNPYKIRLERMKDRAMVAILATEHHLGFPEGKEPTDIVTLLMLDVDMAGFARSFEEVYKDSEKIFKEYEALGLPKEVMLNNRIKFLQALLAKPYIYHTPYFRDTHEIPARSNIEEVIERSLMELDK